MTQLTIVYIIITAVIAVTLYRIIHGVVRTFKSKRPSKCMNCYLKNTCKSQMGQSNACNLRQRQRQRHRHRDLSLKKW